MRISIIVGCAVLLAGQRAHAQDARLRSALDPETLAKVTRLTDSARAESLPIEPLVGVALEGAQRHAAGPRITRAVQDYLVALRGARAALGAEASPPEIVSGAGVLLAGIPGSVLKQIRSSQPHRSLTVPLVVLADLLARGVPKDTASHAIEAATRANARDEDFTALRRQVEQDIVAGASPATATMLRVRNINGVPAAEPVAPLPAVRRP
ncbi:MAG: hypothetical protein ABJF01_07220 [bacterium]